VTVDRLPPHRWWRPAIAAPSSGAQILAVLVGEAEQDGRVANRRGSIFGVSAGCRYAVMNRYLSEIHFSRLQ
jgi:hypothetical protein